MNNATLFYIFFFSALIFFTILIILWVVFGKLIMLQIKRWILASKGYVEVEHISATNVRNYFVMKPKENRFELGDGFYHYIPECITRTGDLIKKVDKAFFSKVPDISPDELIGLNEKEIEEYKLRVIKEWKELKGMYDLMSGVKYDPELLNRKFGMPVITYYGDNPDPMNYANRTKVYGSGVIRDMYLRILLTQRYKDFKLIILIMLVCLAIIAVSNFGLWQTYSGLLKQVTSCNSMLNTSINANANYLNITAMAKVQGSNFVI
jgi:hypothetical protein